MKPMTPKQIAVYNGLAITPSLAVGTEQNRVDCFTRELAHHGFAVVPVDLLKMAMSYCYGITYERLFATIQVAINDYASDAPEQKP